MPAFLHSIDWSVAVPALAAFLQTTLSVAVILRVILTRHPPSASLAWIILVVFLPYVGFFLYIAIGERPLGRWRRHRLRKAIAYWHEVLEKKTAGAADTLQSQRHKGLVRLAERLGDMPMTTGSTLELIGDAHKALRRIIDDIRAARSSITMEFYIWQEGGLVEDVIQELIAAARRGVACKILVDDIGSRQFLVGSKARAMRKAGIHLLSALPVRFFGPAHGRFDLRLHRKTIVIDDKVGYTGSLNMVDPCCFKTDENVGEWVDAVVRVTGTAVEDLNFMLAFDWALQPDDEGHDAEFIDVANVAPTGDARVVVVPSGPTAPDNANMSLIVEAINCARSSILITTPYFVPNEAMAVALQNAAYRGVNVRLLVPMKNDSRFVHYASQRYFEGLMAAGVQIKRFDAGLLHTKAITVDNDFALFGTVNLDNRSLHLNFEMMLLVFDKSFVADLGALMKGYEASCSRVNPEKWHERSIKERFLEGLCYLVSPLL